MASRKTSADQKLDQRKFIGILATSSQIEHAPHRFDAMSYEYPVKFCVLQEPVNSEPTVLEAARQLCEEGAVAIATISDDLARFQTALARHCGVPVGMNDLIQLRNLQARLRNQQVVGILSFQELTHSDRTLINTTVPQRADAILTKQLRDLPVCPLSALSEGEDSKAYQAVAQAMIRTLDQWRTQEPNLGAVLIHNAPLSTYAEMVASARPSLLIRHHQSMIDSLALACGLGR